MHHYPVPHTTPGQRLLRPAGLVCLTLLLTAFPCEAASVLERAQRLFPQTQVDAVEPTPIPGLLEVRAGRTILYMDASGRYVLLADLVDGTSRQSLTTARMRAPEALATRNVTPPSTPPATLAASPFSLAQRLLPDAPIASVEPTPVPGLYAVLTGGKLVYMDATGRYLLLGDLYDFTTRRNLTAQRLQWRPPVSFASLPLDASIRLGPADATRRLALFDDVGCRFCRRFHAEVLPQLLADGTAVHVFLYPITSAQAAQTSRAVWCSADRPAALAAALQDQPVPMENTACTPPLDRIAVIARDLGITGTPTIILDRGVRIDGFVAYDILNRQWSAPQLSSGSPAGMREGGP